MSKSSGLPAQHSWSLPQVVSRYVMGDGLNRTIPGEIGTRAAFVWMLCLAAIRSRQK
jgi:TRAP-type C4-dicarboxylate transport system permease small subunit